LIQSIDRTRLRLCRLRDGYKRIDAHAHGVVDVAGAAELARKLLGPLRL
jgi:hypothetical protein